MVSFHRHAIQNRSKPFKTLVQNQGKERTQTCKNSRQDSGEINFYDARYFLPKFIEICIDSNLVPIRRGTNMAAGKPTETSVNEFC